MRILITSFTDEPIIERDELPGVEVDPLPLPSGHRAALDALLRALEERPAHALISWDEIPYDAEALAALVRAGVRGIVRSSVGYDTVDLRVAQASGLVICNVPDYGTNEVADHAIALLLWCLRGLHAAGPAAPSAAAWDAARFAGLPRLAGRTLALLGFGRIGQAAAHRAQAFGLQVRWLDPYVPRGQEKVTRTTRVETVADLLTGADALSIHCSLTGETRRLIDARALAALPPHAVLVNTARGGVIDTPALHAALREGRLAGAALDVLEREPPVDDALFEAYARGELPTLLITPHVAWYARESKAEMRRKAAAEAGRIARGERPWNPIHPL